MTIRAKDFYQILGVPRTASEDEIRRAYLALARKHHPDINPGDSRAEDKIKDINEAYEILSDPEKRVQFDGLTMRVKPGGFRDGRQPVERPPHRPRHAPGNGPKAKTQAAPKKGIGDFFENLFGGGNRTGKHVASLKSLDSEAEVWISLENAHRGGVQRIALQTIRTCKSCNGKGTLVLGRACLDCEGAGKRLTTRQLDVNIPPGAREGSTIKLPGQGRAGTSKGQRGDLYLKLRVQPHPLFSVVEDDLQLEVPIAPWEALFGATIEVPTIDGKADLKIAAGTQGGQKLRLRGQGLNRREGGRGDEIIRLNIVLEPDPTDREKQLYRDLAELSRYNPRSDS